MNVLIIMLLCIIAISEITFGILFMKKITKYKPNKIELNCDEFDYLKVINNFIRKEFLFEFNKWIMKEYKTIDMNGHAKIPSFVSDLKNPQILNERMTIITASIVSRIGKQFVNVFNTIYYSDNIDDRVSLNSYVARQVMFYIRRFNFEMAALIEREQNKDTKPLDIIKSYVLAIETEIYKINDIEIVSKIEEENDTQSEE